jgi:hypothetical protein
MRAVLRLTGEAHRTRAQLEAELDFVDHLAAGGLEVAPGLASLAGERIVDASRLVASGERTYAAVFARLEGRHFECYSADIDRPLFERWGGAMARLHALSQSFEARPEFRRPDWPDDAVAGCWTAGVAGDDEGARASGSARPGAGDQRPAPWPAPLRECLRRTRPRRAELPPPVAQPALRCAPAAIAANTRGGVIGN